MAEGGKVTCRCVCSVVCYLVAVWSRVANKTKLLVAVWPEVTIIVCGVVCYLVAVWSRVANKNK